MIDQGHRSRLDILRQRLDLVLETLERHHWEVEITEKVCPDHLILICSKGGLEHRIVAPYYSDQQKNLANSLRGSNVAAMFDNHLGPFDEAMHREADGIPLYGREALANLIVSWNTQLAPAPESALRIESKECWPFLRMTSERPEDAIWLRLRQYKSEKLALRLVQNRAEQSDAEVKDSELASKAQGIAFLMRNVDDYFQDNGSKSLSQRILNLYYGTLGLAQAGILASHDGPSSLEEVESFTARGHGLYALVEPGGGFGDIEVGILHTGFFSKWLEFLGHDVSDFPKKRAKDVASIRGDKYGQKAHACMQRLLATVPELGDLYLSVYEAPPSWVIPTSADGEMQRRSRKHNSFSSYISIFDRSDRITLSQLEEAPFAWTELEDNVLTGIGTDKEPAFRARIDHPGFDYWSSVVPHHTSPFLGGIGGAIILPVLGDVYEHRVYAFCILYALSILVRYMPGTWRKVEGGEWDHHLVVIEAILAYYERILPQSFLEEITRHRVVASTSGSIFS